MPDRTEAGARGAGGAIPGAATIFALMRLGGRRGAAPQRTPDLPVKPEPEPEPEPQPTEATALVAATPTSSTRRHPRLRRVAGLGFNSVLIVAAVFALFIAYGTIGNRWYRVVTVTGGSMEPTIMRGDMIVVTPPPQAITPGMIVSMVVDGRVITHRVVKVNDDGSLVTKGDANQSEDDWSGSTVTVVGQYQFLIPQLGRLLPISNGSAAAFNYEGAAGQAIQIGSWSTDTTKPVVTVPHDMTVAASDEHGANVSFAATAVDDVDGSLTPLCAPASGDLFPVGDTTVTCTATDSAGNTGPASFQVTVAPAVLPLTSLDVPNAEAMDGRAVTLSATLTSDGSTVPGRTIHFTIGATAVGDALTNASGAATLSAVSVASSAVGHHPDVISAMFGGDSQFAGSIGSANLTIDPAAQTLKPTITLTTPADKAVYVIGSHGAADYSCSSDSPITTCSGPVADDATLDTASVGWKTFVVNATDADRDTATRSVTYRVVYPFSYIAPTQELPGVNTPIKAGTRVKIRFTMDTWWGPTVLKGWPRHYQVDPVTLTRIGRSAVSQIRKVKYDAAHQQYKLIWRTKASWAGTSRLFVVRLRDGTLHKALFTFV